MKDKLSYEELHEQLMYNPWTGYFYWKVSNTNSVHINDIAGSKHKKGYIMIGINGIRIYAHRLAWFYIYGYMPEHGIDHKDRIKHHNWILNLREATQQCNTRNTGNRKNNTSGIKGVSWHKKTNRWKSSISSNKEKSLGAYKDFDDAVCARLAGEQCLDWEGCDSCSPAYQYVKENIQCH